MKKITIDDIVKEKGINERVIVARFKQPFPVTVRDVTNAVVTARLVAWYPNHWVFAFINENVDSLPVLTFYLNAYSVEQSGCDFFLITTEDTHGIDLKEISTVTFISMVDTLG